MTNQYFQPGEAEEPEKMLWRVANYVAGAEAKYDKTEEQIKAIAQEYFDSMDSGDWMPSSPFLMNAGTEVPMLLACFVLEIQDDLDSIYKTLWDAAKVHKMGGGTGFDFSQLRAKGAPIRSTGGTSSGVLSFLKQYDCEGGTIKQGGRRRAANLGAVRIDHPEIMDFINCKVDKTQYTNFNISVLIPDWFMELVTSSDPEPMYDLIDHNGNKAGQLNAKEVFRTIVRNNWESGEPGMLFIDAINRENKLSHLGRITCTNPCGEIPLLPYEACNLSSVNLSNMVLDPFTMNVVGGRGPVTLAHTEIPAKIDYVRLDKRVRMAVRFMDNAIDCSVYPTEQIKEMVLKTRKLGIGIMGLGEMLIQLGLRYDSEEGRKIAEAVMHFIQEVAMDESCKLAEERGVPEGWYGSDYEKAGVKIRNLTRTCIAPTGTISMIVDTSSGCEPIFAIVYTRNIRGIRYLFTNALFDRIGTSEGWLTEAVREKIAANKGSVHGIDEVPKKWQELFVIAGEISAEDHVKMQAGLQNFVDNSISKTVNMPETATVEDVIAVYILAWKLKCKGTTVYRDNSREGVLTTGKKVHRLRDKFPEEDTKNLRPDLLIGVTMKIQSGCGKLWTTINPFDGTVWEVFSSTGSDGGCTSNIQEIARLVSLSLREGLPISKVIDQLKSVKCARAMASRGCNVKSCSDAIARQIETFLKIYDSEEWEEFLNKQLAKVEVDKDKKVVKIDLSDNQDDFMAEMSKLGGCRSGKCE
jgi:ribonucleoside-diphosphate reductase alpha chain